jgi:hypothetical protein
MGLSFASVSDDFWDGTAWSYRDDEHRTHSDAYLLFQRDLALRNFDLSNVNEREAIGTSRGGGQSRSGFPAWCGLQVGKSGAGSDPCHSDKALSELCSLAPYELGAPVRALLNPQAMAKDGPRQSAN